MDLDNLIPFFILGAFVLTSILKAIARKAKAKQAEKTVETKPKGLFSVLRQRVQDLMEETVRQQARRQSQSGGDADGYGDDRGSVDMSDDLAFASPAVKARAPRPAPSSRPSPGGGRPISSARVPKKSLSGQDLRQAVIWYEILGPPKALREVEGNSPLLNRD